MRRMQIGDLLALAGAVAGRPDAFRHALRLCAEAHAADLYVKRLGRLHPLWGNGSLMSRARAGGARMQADWSPAGVDTLRTACEAVQIWRERLDCRGPRLCANIEPQHEE